MQVCDFGLASNNRSQAGAGTPAYMAPELFEGRPYNEKVMAGRGDQSRCGLLQGDAPCNSSVWAVQ